jgi:tetratricopeptide (TPR) repeat protein
MAMRCETTPLFVLMLIAGFSGAAAAQTLDEQRCYSHDPDLSIAGCTAIIQTGQKPEEELAKVFNYRGFAYGRKQLYDLAIQDDDEAIRLKPNYPNAFFNRGNAYYGKGQLDRAIQDFDQAIRLNPNGRGPEAANVFLMRGETYRGKGQNDLAIQDYDEAIRLYPSYARAFNARGVALRALGQQGRADADFAKAKQLNQPRANVSPRRMSLIDRLFPPLMIFGVISPFLAIFSAFVFYGLHCGRIEPERRVSVIGYALAVIVCGVTAGYFGLGFGIALACSSPTSPNLCGLWGFFVTGPISFALAIFLVGLALSLVRPGQSSGGT